MRKAWNLMTGNKGDNEDVKMQSQVYADDSMKMTAEQQTFMEQVTDTFEAVVLAAEMSQNPQYNEAIVNRVTDGAVLALNMMAVSCKEIHDEANQDALDLAKKTVFDKWEALKRKDIKTYKLTIPYRDYIIAALNGTKQLRYKSTRVKETKLSQNEPQDISASFGRIIHSNQQFDKHQQQMLDPEVNQKLAAQHRTALKSYRTNNKYKTGATSQGYRRPDQSALYFTKSGKKAQFVDNKAERDRKMVENELMGVEDAYSKLPKLSYQNALIRFSAQFKYKGLNKPFPCLILMPNRQNSSKIYEKIQVRLAYPYNDAVLQVDVEALEFDVDKIRQSEAKVIKKVKDLGYPSIEKQQKAMDIDED